MCAVITMFTSEICADLCAEITKMCALMTQMRVSETSTPDPCADVITKMRASDNYMCAPENMYTDPCAEVYVTQEYRSPTIFFFYPLHRLSSVHGPFSKRASVSAQDLPLEARLAARGRASAQEGWRAAAAGGRASAA